MNPNTPLLAPKIKNYRERQVVERHERDGWEALRKGWPDFLFVKDGVIKMVEVKRKTKLRGSGMSAHQRRMKELLSKYFEYTAEYID